MIRLIKIPPEHFEMEEIMGNIVHFKIFKLHFKISTFPSGLSIAFSYNYMYELEYINIKKRPDLKPNPNDNWYETLLRVG